MRHWDDTLDIDMLRQIGNRLLRIFRFIPHFELQPDYTFIYSYPMEMRKIGRRHRICLLTGHMWEVETYDSPNDTFHLKCVRCFPHIDSRKTVVSYDPFTTVERKTD